MKVSQKAEYALRAMLELAIRHGQPNPVRSAEIASSQNIPEKFLELILVDLRRAGLIVSQRGPVGGHRLARTPAEIAVGEIWRTIDGSLHDRSANGNGKQPDPFRGVWEEVDRAISNVVDKLTLEEIRKRAEQRQNVPDFSI
jgi:Rrf2 family protein